MARFNERAVVGRILELMGERAFEQIQPLIGSRTLRGALELILEATQNEARLHIPHYWAVYYHDGRRGFGPRNAPFLIFFANPTDDPRFEGSQTPERASQVRRLTRSEYLNGLRRNRARARSGRPPFMFVIRDANGQAGKVGPQRGTFFFESGANGLADEFSDPNRQVACEFDAAIQDMLDDELLDRESGVIDL